MPKTVEPSKFDAAQAYDALGDGCAAFADQLTAINAHIRHGDPNAVLWLERETRKILEAIEWISDQSHP